MPDFQRLTKLIVKHALVELVKKVCIPLSRTGWAPGGWSRRSVYGEPPA